MHNEELSLEFLTMYNVFERANAIRRTSDLNTKTAYSGSSMILPKNVMLHMLDNFGHSDQTTDVIDIDRYPFLTGKNNLKYLHNFVDFESVPKDELNKFSHRLYRAKLIETLKIYGMEHRRTVIPVPKLDAVIGNKNSIIVENYNPLYRYITTNNRPISQYWRYRAFLRTVLNNLKNYDRLHFLVIPVPDMFEYTRSNIMSIIQTGEVSSQKLISSSHFYFFIIDLVALLLDNNSRLSSLNTTDKRTLNELNIMLINKEKSIIFNMGKLATLARTKTYIFSFVDNISRISGVNVPVTVIADAEADPMIEEPEEKDIPVIQNQSTQSSQTSSNQSIVKNAVNTPVKSVTEPIVSIIKPAPRIIHQETKLPEKEEPVVDEKEETLDDLLPKEEPVVEAPILSDKQKDRIAALAEKHKSIRVNTPEGSKTIHEIVTAPINIELKAPVATDNASTATTTKVFDQQYQEKLLRKDILTNILAFSENGLYLVDYAEKNEYNSFTRVKHIKASFQDANGKKHTINLKLPMPDEDGYYLVNGVNLNLSKQLVNVPICKISPTRVSLISNYNKTLVDKVESTRYSFADHISKKGSNLNMIPKHNTYVGVSVPYDYKLIGSSFSVINTQTYEFFFEYDNRFDHFKVDLPTETLTELEQSYGVLVGKSTVEKNVIVFIDKKNQCVEYDITRMTIRNRNNSIINYFDEMSVPAEWCNLKILDKNLPIVFILSYRYGLSTVVRNLGIKYTFVKPGEKYAVKPTEIVIQFNDGKLIFDRYPLEHSYILAGLTYFNSLKDIPIIDMDGKDAYYKLLTDKGMSTNYLKGIDAYFSFFIDPITKEVLQEMGEPTNTRDLLIRAVDMLINDNDKQPSALSNFRVRGAERLPAMIYNEIARQYADYTNSNYKDVSFSINAEAIFQRLIQDQTMTLREDINPMHAIKEQTRVTYTGFGGRSSEAFVQRDRKYPEDALGILAETTTDSGSVGMVGSLTGDPKITNLRGMFNTEQGNLTAENIFSDTTLLLPGATHDDPKRANFSSVQISHHIPTANQTPNRLTTGYEKVIPFKTSSSFVGKAKKDGRITNIDAQLNLVTIQYTDGTTDVFEFGSIIGEIPGMAVNHKIGLMPNIRVGTQVKKDTVITYHTEFFHLDPITHDLSWCHGVQATVALMPKDVTLEDSCMLSTEFSHKLGFESIYARPLTISTDMIIKEFADVGTKVSFNSSLVKVQYEDVAEIVQDVDELFDELKQVEYRSKYDGEVVGIQVYYVAESLNPSLTRFVNKVTYKNRRKSNVAKGTLKEVSMSHVTIVPEGTRIRGVQLTATDVLVVFHIKSKIACGIGDKIVFGNMLKSVIGRIDDKPIVTEHGEVVDAVFGANSVFDRIVLSPFIQGISEKVIGKVEDDVVKMYFGE